MKLIKGAIALPLSIALNFLSLPAAEARQVDVSSVNYVYQLDSDATVFEFNSTVPHACGSSLYQVHSPNEAVANRKFSLVLAAFTTKSNLVFHDTETCVGNRSVVGWVRITHN